MTQGYLDNKTECIHCHSKDLVTVGVSNGVEKRCTKCTYYYFDRADGRGFGKLVSLKDNDWEAVKNYNLQYE